MQTYACDRRKRGASAAIAVALCATCLLNAPPAAHAQTDTTAVPDVVGSGGPQLLSSLQPPTTTTTTAQHQAKYDDSANTELLKQVLMKKCLHRYTMTCLKLDLVRLIDRLGTARAYQLVPGVSLVRASDGNQSTTSGGGGGGGGGHHHQQNQQNQHHQQHHHHGGIPPDVVRSLVRGNDSADELDGYLMEKVDAYLNSLSISVKLVDSAVVEKVRNLSSQMLVNILPTGLLETGRGKKDGMKAALWSAGTLAAIAFASLAAMSGKALMTAMLALVLAAVCALKGHGGGGGGGGGGGYGKTSHYEIITKPAIYDHEHLVHGASYSSAPYSYARHLTMDENGGTHHPVGRGPLQPQRVSVVHAAPAAPANAQSGDASGPGQQAGDDDADDEASVGRLSYPLAPIAYIPTNNA
ncbi:uncharacterized protein LOC111039454 isoform X2 [Myzus persicae]|uniref:uncharacterized protein LOC111039454 isoform X2 n=1 Tax=Myzus persicae TaxID=13164 RepID=UPI000B934E40|nr:uncharacterized protein LOC111039454 isoform X2 [Myzus persicae]